MKTKISMLFMLVAFVNTTRAQQIPPTVISSTQIINWFELGGVPGPAYCQQLASQYGYRYYKLLAHVPGYADSGQPFCFGGN